MRDLHGWRRGLQKRLREEARARGVTINASVITQVELGLTLLRLLCPTADATTLWGMLSGYPLPHPERAEWTPDQHLALAAARFRLVGARGRRNWEQLVRRYLEQPADFRLFDIQRGSWEYRERPVAIVADRVSEYQVALAIAPSHITKQLPTAGAGRWQFYVGQRTHEVTLPEMPVWTPATPLIAPGKANRPAISVSLAELRATAEAMDRATGNRFRKGESFNRTRLEWVEAFGKLTETDRLEISGAVNLVGILGAGKSTLMDVLAVWAAKQGYHVTVVVGDTVAVLDRVELYKACGVPVAPLMGGSNRVGQIRKFHSNLGDDGRGELAPDHPGFRWLSSICPLDGLRQDTEPLRPGTEPCEGLFPVDADGKVNQKAPHACPFLPVCPVHERYRALPGARIWVATPQSLVYTQVPSSVMPERMRLIETVYRASDLVIVDEADRVQAQLDLAFVPGQTLVDTKGGWLGSLLGRIKLHPEYQSRRAVADTEVARWIRALDNADAAANRIYEMLQQYQGLRKWVGQAFFTASALFDRVIQTTFEDPANRTTNEPDDDSWNRSELSESFQRFVDDPMGDDGPQDPTVRMLTQLARALVTSDLDITNISLRKWLEELAEVKKVLSDLGEAALRVQFAIAVAVLDHHVNLLLANWRAAADVFDLGDAEHGGYLPAPAEHGLLIPEAPMGNLLGFQYVAAPGDKGPGLLRFFRCLGLGRWLLLRLPTLFRDLDRIAGPHLLLLSGTSWAPRDLDRYDSAGAPGYHLQLPVSGVLSGPPSEMEGVSKSRFFFAPQRDEAGDPIHVSGQPIDRRPLMLQAMTARLAEPGKGLLDRVMANLPEDRKRILLLVGSYRDAQRVTEQLLQRADLKGQVICLIPDDAEDDEAPPGTALARGEVASFAATGGRILVAPLMSVERGHNILNEIGEAALGAAFFLSRPMPVPGDLTGPIQATSAFAIFRMSDKAWLVERAEGKTTLDALAKTFRRTARILWRERLRQHGYFRTKTPEERQELVWTQLIMHWQAIGRLVRGGVPAEVYFCDASYMPATALAKGKESVLSSVLLGYEEVLRKIKDDPIAERLYGPLIRALEKKEVIL